MATQYKRALKKAYEIKGIRIAMETSALFAYHRAMDSEYARKMDELIKKVPLKQYLNTRDDPYRDSLLQMKKLLEKSKQFDR
jgi:hypothetical protein